VLATKVAKSGVSVRPSVCFRSLAKLEVDYRAVGSKRLSENSRTDATDFITLPVNAVDKDDA